MLGAVIVSTTGFAAARLVAGQPAKELPDPVLGNIGENWYATLCGTWRICCAYGMPARGAPACRRPVAVRIGGALVR